MNTATLEARQEENREKEDLRRLQKVRDHYGARKARESSLQADYVDELYCKTCGDEYSLFARWSDNSVVERDKECTCPIDPHVEREAIALHHNPPEPDWSPALVEVDARCDEIDNLHD